MITYCLGLAMAVLASCAPSYAMKTPTKKRKIDTPSVDNYRLKLIRLGFFGVLVGCDKGLVFSYQQGISAIKKHKHLLRTLSYQQLNISDGFIPNFLKILVIKKEYELLPHFLAMYDRSYPEDKMGINMIFSSECLEPSEIPPDQIDSPKTRRGQARNRDNASGYTLLDVAYTAYVVARAENKSGDIEKKVMRTLTDLGADTYANISTAHRAIIPGTLPN